ncbi:CBS domain-containing protein [Methanocaldococcus infernus]|uniref:Signal transduction protein with CBS domains n=1 Tax=Methanocaldococcus infernus (strain DSM 11812 / JCM 15783 / ME) TaxID=573063 RepID=D5VTJ6_METIM|nr:CBS domain-containing protein [Methanocaldococcus infernus]ADG13899.1 putative signal transduction protein with CBS domains [Methanocaldococcus infernus ME]
MDPSLTNVPVLAVMSEPLFLRNTLSAEKVLELMLKKNKRYCILVDQSNNPVGILTIFDILKYSVLNNTSDLSNVKAMDLATRKIVTIYPETSIEDALKIMKKYNITKLPIIDKSTNKIVGVISEEELVDTLPYLIDSLNELVNYLLDIISEELGESEKKEKILATVKNATKKKNKN